MCVIVSGEQFQKEPLTNQVRRSAADQHQNVSCVSNVPLSIQVVIPPFKCFTAADFVSCVSWTWGLTCGSAGETQAAGLWGRREPAERWRPSNPGPPGSLPQTDLHPLACRYFPKRADLKPFSSAPNGINTQGKLIMHRTDWVFAFINDNFKLDEAQIGQFKKRLMGSYCHFSEKMHRASIFHKRYCKKKKSSLCRTASYLVVNVEAVIQGWY